MIGKRISDYINKHWPIKTGDAQLPTKMIKGIAVEIDFTVTCNAHNLTETIEYIQILKDQITKERKTLHFSMETRLIIGSSTVNTPRERDMLYQNHLRQKPYK
jgi:hypothetical protein